MVPVSSSAHVALLLQDVAPGQRKELEVALHAGTLLALGRPAPHAWLVAATVPAAVAGALLEGPIERRLGTPRTVAAGLVAGGVAMVLADRAPQRRRHGRPTPADGIAVGIAQALALVPGVSRHGAAITALRARGLPRGDAHVLSREASKPVLAGAAALKAGRLLARRPGHGGTAGLAVAAAASALSTRVALVALRRRATAGPLWPYAVYRAVLAAVVLGSVRRVPGTAVPPDRPSAETHRGPPGAMETGRRV